MKMFEVEVFISDGFVFIQQNEENAIQLDVDQCDLVCKWISDAAKSVIKNQTVKETRCKE